MMSVKDASNDAVKTFLRTYSRFLRRDFLAILVKMTAKELGIRTVRSDWRTRKGMLAFLSASWERFVDLCSRETIFKWYCTHFDAHEKVFSHRKLMMFIYANWSQFCSVLSTPSVLMAIKNSQNEIESYLNAGPNGRNQAWTETESGKQFFEIVNQFKGASPAPAVIKPVAKPAPVEEFKPIEIANFDPSLETSPEDDIVIESTYDCLPFEIGTFASTEFSYNPQMQFAYNPFEDF